MHTRLQPQTITDELWNRIGKQPGEAIHILTWDDVVSVLANQMASQGLTAEAFTDNELDQLLVSGGDVQLPWEETIEILLMLVWPETCQFNAQDTRLESKFHTTTLFWQCECSEITIHTRSQEQCPECRAVHDECPDARVGDVRANKDKFLALMQFMEDEFESYQAGLPGIK